MYLFFKYFTFDPILCVCALAMYEKISPFRFRVNSDIAPYSIFENEIRYWFLTKNNYSMINTWFNFVYKLNNKEN